MPIGVMESNRGKYKEENMTIILVIVFFFGAVMAFGSPQGCDREVGVCVGHSTCPCRQEQDPSVKDRKDLSVP